MTHTLVTRGIVLFAHGSRDPLWHQPMEAVAARIVHMQPDAVVRCAYLELSTPDLPTVVKALVDQGIGNITIVPMFLGVGRHAREDLPELVQSLQVTYPMVTFTRQAAVGEDPRLISLLANIALDEGALNR
jgi:sirohydrochlorin cobaltochelatase